MNFEQKKIVFYLENYSPINGILCRVLNISFCRKFEISKFRKFVFCHISGIRIIGISEFAKFEYRILKKTEKNACFSQDILWCSMANMPIQDSIVKQIQNSTTFCYLGRGRPRRNMHMHVGTWYMKYLGSSRKIQNGWAIYLCILMYFSAEIHKFDIVNKILWRSLETPIRKKSKIN